MITRTGALITLGRTLTRQNPVSVLRSIQTLPEFFQSSWKGHYPGVSRTRLGLYLLAVLYILSPVDLAPEMVLLGLGVLDDLFVFAWLSGALLEDTQTYLQWKKAHKRTHISGEALSST